MTERVEAVAERIEPDDKTKQPTTERPGTNHGFNLLELRKGKRAIADIDAGAGAE